VPKSTTARVTQQQEKLPNEWTLREGKQGISQKRKRDGKDPGVQEALTQWFSIVTGRGVCVSGQMLKSKSEELVISWVTTISKQQMVGCVDGNAGFG
jgi:hypothetical protein